MTTTARPFTKGYADTSYGQIHYRVAGPTDGAPVVFIHQSPSSGAMWEPVLPLFAQRGYRAIAFDMPGFGNSDRPPYRPTMSDYAKAMVEAAAALGVERADVVGHHTGVTTAMVMADEFPDHVRKLVLWGVPMFPPERMARFREEQGPVFSEDGAELVRFWNVRRRMSNPTFSTHMALRCMVEKLQVGEISHWGHNALGWVNHEATAKRIKHPTLVMCSDGDGAIVKESRLAATIFPNGRYLDLPGASLDVADEYPEEFTAAVDAFLKE
ncbi:MAG: alpha/beta hydrolase [Dehalococcoidia bacterium]|nr:alpha/beta hydrolase [Dehalococcoidia bacterium]